MMLEERALEGFKSSAEIYACGGQPMLLVVANESIWMGYKNPSHSIPNLFSFQNLQLKDDVDGRPIRRVCVG